MILHYMIDIEMLMQNKIFVLRNGTYFNDFHITFDQGQILKYQLRRYKEDTFVINAIYLLRSYGRFGNMRTSKLLKSSIY